MKQIEEKITKAAGERNFSLCCELKAQLDELKQQEMQLPPQQNETLVEAEVVTENALLEHIIMETIMKNTVSAERVDVEDENQGPSSAQSGNTDGSPRSRRLFGLGKLFKRRKGNKKG